MREIVPENEIITPIEDMKKSERIVLKKQRFNHDL